MVRRILLNVVIILSLLMPACNLSLLPPTPIKRADATLAKVLAKDGEDLSTLTPQNPVAAKPVSDAHAALDTGLGTLRLPVVMDADNDANTNPDQMHAVGVVRIGSPTSDEIIQLAEVTLGVEVIPRDDTQNPAGTVVEFHLWSADGHINQLDPIRADAWGAAFTKINLLDGGRYFFQASAPGFGQTPVRSFEVDPDLTYMEMQLDALPLQTHIAGDGTLVADVEASMPIDEAPGSVELSILRLLPGANNSTTPQVELMPSIFGLRLDANHGRVEAKLEAGAYMVQAKVTGGKVRALSEYQIVNVPAHDTQVEVTQLPATQAKPDLATIPTADPVQASTPATITQRTLLQTWREGAFQWRTTAYTATIETIVDDGKKAVTLEDFSYEPIARRYGISIQSLMTQTVEDHVTVEVLGPNGVVIYEETAPITLVAGESLRYEVTVPADRGEPKGLRVTVHDPNRIAAFFETGFQALSIIFDVIVSSTGETLKAGLSVVFRVETALTAFKAEIVTVGITCQFPGTTYCTFTKSGAIFQSDPVAYLKPKLQNYVREQIGTTFDKFLENLVAGFPLAGHTIKVPFGIRYTKNLIDPAACVNSQALEAAKKEVARISYQVDLEATRLTALLNNFGLKFKETVVSTPIALAPAPLQFIYFEFAGSADIKVKGGKTPDGLGLIFDFGPEFGTNGQLLLKPFSAVDVAVGLYEIGVFSVSLVQGINIGYGAYNVVKIIQDVGKFSAGGNCGAGSGGAGNGSGKGGNNPPPPGGFPDDRRDALELEFLPEPTGVSGNQQTLQQQLLVAQALGLTRAEKYLTFALRRQELLALESDTSRQLEYTNELLSVTVAASATMNSLISGATLPPPGQTITDAVTTIYSQTVTAFSNTAFDRDLRTLRDARDFAERQYFNLRGQELELQLELRQLHGGIGVLDSGLWSWAMGAIGTIGVIPKLLHILPGDASDAYEADYVSPLAAPPVVFVPTGGLNRYQNNEQARRWLEEYVASGGILVVLTQYENADWGLLPGGQVEGLGYKDDILCKDASVHIVNPSPWITGLDKDYPNIQIDGSFTSWPSNANIVWMRRTGNEKPAMLEYAFGAGQVVATASYPDFYINGMQSADDVTFARSLFSIAYLRANNQQVTATVAPNSPLALNVPVDNNTATDISGVVVSPDVYDQRVDEAWRWAVHAPYLGLGGGEQTFVFTPTIPSGQSTTVNFAFNAPPRAGIYRVGSVVPKGYYGDTITVGLGPFYQVKSNTVAVDLFNARLTQDQPDYAVGQTATLTVTLRNDQAVARTFVITPEVGLSGPVITLNAAPNQTVTQLYQTRVTNFREVRLRVGENNKLLSTLVTTLKLRRPALGIQVSPLRVAANLATSAQISVTARYASLGSPVKVEILRQGSTVVSTTVPLIAAGDYGLAIANLNLPANLPGTDYRVRAEVDDNACGLFACVIRQTLPIVPVATLRGLHFNGTASLNFAQNNPDALLALLQGSEFPGTQQLVSTLQSGAMVLSTGAPAASAVTNGEQELLLNLPLPTALPIDQPLTVAGTLTTLATGAASGYTSTVVLPFTLNPPLLSVLDPIRYAGEPVRAQLVPPTLAETNQAIPLPPQSPLTVTVSASDGFSQTYIVTNALSVSGRLDFTVTLPSTIARGGIYALQVRSPHLTNWIGSASFQVPTSAFAFDALATLPVGQTAPFALRNLGGADSAFNGAVYLKSNDGITLATVAINAPVTSRAAINSSIAIPTQLVAGSYQLQAVGLDHLGEAVNVVQNVTLAGLVTSLSVHTDRIAYLSTDPVTTTSRITTNLPITDGTLRLRVVKPSGASIPPTEDWRASRADSGNSNHTYADLTPPFTQGWSITHDEYPVGNPLSVNGMLIVVDSNSQLLQARAAATGQLVWETPYDSFGFSIQVMAANSTQVMLLIDNTVIAYEAATGAFQWSQFIGADVYTMLLSDSALVVLYNENVGSARITPVETHPHGRASMRRQIATVDGYILLNPATGAALGITIAENNAAVLVDNHLFLARNDSGTYYVTAYDATTGSEVWSTETVPFLEVIAANATYVLAHDVNTHQLYVFAAANGALLHTIQLNADFAPGNPPQNFVLDGATFYYAITVFDVGGNGVALYQVDLSSGTHTPSYTQTPFEFRALVGDGAHLYLLQESPRTLVTLVANGGSLLDTTDLSSLTSPSLQGLIVGRYGPVVVTEEEVFALIAADTGDGEPTGEITLREDWLAIDGGSSPLSVLTLDYALISPTLTANPEARGQLYLEGTLFASEPQSIITPTLRQVLARGRYGFFVSDSSAALALVADQAEVRQNVANYAADDALAGATLRGVARNTSALPADVTVTITRSDGTVVYNQLFPTVAVSATVDFTVNDGTPPVGTVTYTATTNLGGSATTTLAILLPNLAASVTLSPTSIALGQSTDATVVLHNNNATVPSVVTVDWGAGQLATLVLDQGATMTLTHTYIPTAVGVFNPNIVLSGDSTAALQAASGVDVRDESVTVTSGLDGVLRDATTLVLTADAALTYTVSNDSDETFDVAISYVINSPSLKGASIVTLTPFASKTITVPLNSIGVGAHSATFTATHALVGNVLGVSALAFQIVAPQTNVALQAAIGDITPSQELPISITVSSENASDLPWHGTLVIEGAIRQRSEFTLAPGGSYAIAPLLALADNVGLQSINILLIGPDGEIVAQRSFVVQTQLRQASTAQLTSLSASPGVPGGLVTLSATINNPGAAGEAILAFTAFDQVVEQMVSLPAASQVVVTQTVNVPASLIEGVFEATVQMDQESQRADIVVSGPQIQVSQSLDAAAYLPFTNAVYSVRLQGISGAAAPYDVILRHDGDEFMQTVTIGAGSDQTVQWTFDVGQVSDRATVLVRTHPNAATDPLYTLIVDTIWVRVIEDDRAWLESDRDDYQAGDTVNLTIHLLTPVNRAFVLGSSEIPAASDSEISNHVVVWSSLEAMSASNVYTSVVGTYTAAYPLPAMMRTGRYFFRLFFDGEERTLPIDVQGVTLRVEEMTVETATSVLGERRADVNTTIRANVRVNQALPNTVIEAYALTPGGLYRKIGDATYPAQSFAAGLTPIQITGVFTTEQPGSHQVIFKVRDAGTLAMLGGDARFVDVGDAMITSLTVDHGVYAPGNVAAGTVTLYNGNVAHVTVRTSGGTVLLDQTITEQGHISLPFMPPTNVVMDEVLIGEVTDSQGLKTTLQRAYKVATTFDTEAPQVQIVTPAPNLGLDGARLEYTDPGQLNINVTGIVTENVALASVVVNDVTATVNGPNWSAPLTLATGTNFIEVIATDQAGIVGYAARAINTEPSYGIALSLTPVTSTVGGSLEVQAIITVTEVMTVSALFPFSHNGLTPTGGSATSGNLDLTQTGDHPDVSWWGVVAPGTPVNITWTATANQIISDTAYAVANGTVMGVNSFEARISNAIGYVVKAVEIPPTDSDSDGLSDADEQTRGTNPNDADSDDDEVNDGDEVGNNSNPLDPCSPDSDDPLCDQDQDGLTNAAEATLGTNPLLADTDGDTINDGTEVANGSDPLDECSPNAAPCVPTDTDGDGLSNEDEQTRGTNPNDADSDDDGVNDGSEVANNSNPLDPCSPDSGDPLCDQDQDGLTNAQEAKRKTNPILADTDGDGVNDGTEVANNSNPLNPCNPDSGDPLCDKDNDGLTNAEEANLKTNPAVADSDGDGVKDGTEVDNGSNPLDPCDPNGAACVPTDTDGDGLSNEDEQTRGTNPNDADSDDDGVNDGSEVANSSNPLDPCSPDRGDALCDQDQDGLTNAEEINRGTNPTDADSDGDEVNDGIEVANGSDPLDECDPNPTLQICTTGGTEGSKLFFPVIQGNK